MGGPDATPLPRLPRVRVTARGTVLVERFSLARRLEHLAAIATFLVLVLTGFPQRFYDAAWAAWIFDALGGLDVTRQIHRIAGFVFTGHAVLHLVAFGVGLATGKMRPSLLPVPQDLRDAWANLLYYLGHREAPPLLPKFDYRQKFEYVGMVLGGVVMIASGLVLLFPIETAALLPGEVIPAARVAHSNEALLAFLVLLVWHLYGSHFSPDVFPMDRSIFTGYQTKDALRRHHTLEYRRLFGDEGSAEVPGEDGVPGRGHEPTAETQGPPR